MGVSSFFSRKETVVNRSISPSLINRNNGILRIAITSCSHRLHPKTDHCPNIQRIGKEEDSFVISLYLDLFHLLSPRNNQTSRLTSPVIGPTQIFSLGFLGMIRIRCINTCTARFVWLIIFTRWSDSILCWCEYQASHCERWLSLFIVQESD